MGRQAVVRVFYSTLQAFVHISTAYSSCNRATIDEVIYPTSTTPQAVFEIVTGMTEEEAAGVTAK